MAAQNPAASKAQVNQPVRMTQADPGGIGALALALPARVGDPGERVFGGPRLEGPGPLGIYSARIGEDRYTVADTALRD